MELRHLRHFVAVAELQHFGRAAARLGMAQPPLSQSIMRLEESLGTRLLERTSRGVVLTAAGNALLNEARSLIAQADLAERRVRQVGADECASLRIAFVPMCAMRVVPLAMKELHKQWPGVEVRLIERGSALTVASVKSGTIDFGVVARASADVSGLESFTIGRIGVVAAVPSTWPVARCSTLHLSALAGYPLIMFPQQLTHPAYDTFEAACREVGFAPNVTQQARHPYTMLNLIANELGIGLLPDSARHLPVEGVTFIEVEDMPRSFETDIALVWADRRQQPFHRAMLDIMRTLARVPS